MKRRALMGLMAALVLAGWVMGCHSAAASTKPSSRPTLPRNARPTAKPGLSADDVNRGAKLCANKCLRCHQLYDPSAYSDSQWRSWMTKMTGKAHLKNDQAELLSRYLEAFRAADR